MYPCGSSLIFLDPMNVWHVSVTIPPMWGASHLTWWNNGATKGASRSSCWLGLKNMLSCCHGNSWNLSLERRKEYLAAPTNNKHLYPVGAAVRTGGPWICQKWKKEFSAEVRKDLETSDCFYSCCSVKLWNGNCIACVTKTSKYQKLVLGLLQLIPMYPKWRDCHNYS